MSSASTASSTQALDPRRWRALGVLALVQFMLVLDTTVVNVALPSIQRDLHFSASGLAWVVSGYTLMAGGFLILGGRAAEGDDFLIRSRPARTRLGGGGLRRRSSICAALLGLPRSNPHPYPQFDLQNRAGP